MNSPVSVYTGTLLGTAIGDAVLLPGEGMSRSAIARRFPGPLRHRLAFGRGLISDDTEHAFFTTQALLAHPEEVTRFRRSLAWKLRWWFVALPGGVGFATARACLRLWIGIPPDRSGVWSAGNGAAMRAAIIGVRFCENQERRASYITASTLITHRDPKARIAARAIAEAAAWAVRKELLPSLWSALVLDTDAEWSKLMEILRDAYESQETVDHVAKTIGCERFVSGYSYHSVPIALYAWLRHRSDARSGLAMVFRCGGDVDSIGALTGALYGADGGEESLPHDWIRGLADWPLSKSVLRHGAQALAAQTGPVSWKWYLQPLRNLLFLVIIILHGFRRLVP